MRALLANVWLALVWAAVTGDFRPENLLLGGALGYAIVHFAKRAEGADVYGRRVAAALRLSGAFLWELVMANLRVAYDVLTPRHHMRPAIVALPLQVESDAEITLLANLITLTPGSVTLDVSADRTTLYMHVMYMGDDVEVLRRHVQRSYERRVLEVMR